MARYFRTWALAARSAVIVLAGFVDLTSPGEEITARRSPSAARQGACPLEPRHDARKQIDFADDLAERRDRAEAWSSLGFVYPHLAVRNYDDLRRRHPRKGPRAISQLSDKGKGEDPASRFTYVWLLDYDNFSDGARLTYTSYTQDAGRSTAALYDYRLGLLRWARSSIWDGRPPADPAPRAPTADLARWRPTPLPDDATLKSAYTTRRRADEQSRRRATIRRRSRSATRSSGVSAVVRRPTSRRP